MILIGLILTLAPVVYVALESAQMLKVAAVLTLFLIAAIFAIGAQGWANGPQVVTQPRIPTELIRTAARRTGICRGGRAEPVPVQLDP